MKNFRTLAHLTAALALLASSEAATFSSSATAPTVGSTDIANLAAQTGTDKWFFQSANEANPSDAAKGQTFTTGSRPVLFKGLTYKIGAGNLKAATAANPTTWTIRLGTLSGTNFTLLASETAQQTADTGSGHYIKWSFTTPVLLAANTTYAVDVGMLSRTAWTTGIPYIGYSGNVTTTGVGIYYDSGDLGVGAATVTTTAARDRIFHVDLEHPMNPTPAIGAVVPAGNVALSWTNLTPTTGTDVWVDVWFGTNLAALTKVVDAGLNVTTTTVNAPGGATYYWRVDSYLGGASTGSPTTGDVFNFTVSDSDGDGLPDSFELAYTSPASNTSMTPGGDLDGDGLTNLQEYQRGTIPNDADTDNDTLLDGAEVSGAAPRPATNPLLADTDGDGLNDGAETNTGTWVSAANTGTNPTKADTDSDGLKDGAETNTGTYVSATNTGTNPLVTDTDGDGAGDWYEVAIIDKKPSLGSPPNSPNNATLKPNVPYPMPAPDASTGVTNKPVKVYIMSGQSNMVGFGQISGSGPGTLQTITGSEKKFPNLVASGGGWTTRNDVKYQGVITDVAKGNLKADVAGTSYGPELGFGYVMGWYHDEPVLLIKASQGNRGLMWDILPPGSPRTVYGATTYPAYGESPETWATAGGGPTPFNWYAGKQYDDFFLKENDMGPSAWASAVAYPASCQVRSNGVVYISKSAHTSAATSEPGVGATWSTFWSVYSVFNTADILDNFATEYPSWAAQGFEIAGFVWWQGYDDTGEPRATRYEPNMVQFIKQIRAYYENRYNNDASALTKTVPNAPFVLATLATNGGWGNTDAGSGKVAQAQLNVDGAKGIYPEFAGNVKTMEARGFWRDSSISPSTQGYHYNWNAETYLLVGDALGRGMVAMLTAADTTPPTLTTIADDKSGGPITANTAVNYTVTFSEDMDASTVAAADFGNAGTATATIGAISETAPGVFSVQATPTTAGTLRLQINAGAIFKDAAGNSLVTTAALLDDTTITVNPAPGYATWATTNAPSGTAGADFDGDGVSNGVEYVLGGTASARDGGKLPGIAVTGGNVVFTFHRAQSSIDGATTLAIETGTDVGTWTNSYAVPDGAASNNPGVSVVKNTSPGIDTVTLSVPQGTKTFVRLKVVMPAS